MSTILADPWTIRDADFPADGTLDEKLEFLLGYAVLAPSSHNTQPWRFHVCGDAVEVYADRTRALRIVDPRDRELLISVGASLFFLRLAMRRFGWSGEITLFPDREDPDLVAIVTPGGEAEPSVEELRLFEAITTRRTHRGDFESRPVPPAPSTTMRGFACCIICPREFCFSSPPNRRASYSDPPSVASPAIRKLRSRPSRAPSSTRL